MPISDETRDQTINELLARIGALERLVVNDVGQRWTPEAVERWADTVMTANDDVASPSEEGRAAWHNAFGKLAAVLRYASRQLHSR